MLKIERHPTGPRVYALGLRIHHGLTGTLLLVVGARTHQPALVTAGALLVADDLHDFPWNPRERAATAPTTTGATNHAGRSHHRILGPQSRILAAHAR